MIDWPSAESVQYWSGLAAIFSLPAAIWAIFYAAGQLSLARKAGSGASLIALSEAFRQGWSAFLTAPEKQRRHAFADLANSLEIACAIFRDGVFFGHSKSVLEFYLVSVFRLIQDSEPARDQLASLLQTRETFENIRIFIIDHQKQLTRQRLPHRDLSRISCMHDCAGVNARHSQRRTRRREPAGAQLAHPIMPLFGRLKERRSRCRR